MDSSKDTQSSLSPSVVNHIAYHIHTDSIDNVQIGHNNVIKHKIDSDGFEDDDMKKDIKYLKESMEALLNSRNPYPSDVRPTATSINTLNTDDRQKCESKKKRQEFSANADDLDTDGHNTTSVVMDGIADINKDNHGVKGKDSGPNKDGNDVNSAELDSSKGKNVGINTDHHDRNKDTSSKIKVIYVNSDDIIDSYDDNDDYCDDIDNWLNDYNDDYRYDNDILFNDDDYRDNNYDWPDDNDDYDNHDDYRDDYDE